MTPVVAPGESLDTKPSLLLLLVTESLIWKASTVVGKLPAVTPAM
jgi:hypothetical protein